MASVSPTANRNARRRIAATVPVALLVAAALAWSLTTTGQRTADVTFGGNDPSISNQAESLRRVDYGLRHLPETKIGPMDDYGIRHLTRTSATDREDYGLRHLPRPSRGVSGDFGVHFDV
jgi:hypothetical protein